MKVAVAGLWHLGSVTAACLAKAGYNVIGYDCEKSIVANLKAGTVPIFEPELETLISSQVSLGKLRFTTYQEEMREAEIVWITYDTPVDDNDIADVAFVICQIKSILPFLSDRTLVIVSSQVPVGTTRQLIAFCRKNYPDKQITFAYSPENLRLGNAIDSFTKPDRIIMGLEDERDKHRVELFLKIFTGHIVWMSVESAEMTKHALNAFLATSVVFINEIATLCERVGADAREVERGLKSEGRIGPKAYLRPGGAIAGGTLARDVNFLIQTGQAQQQDMPLFSALLISNEAHKRWLRNRLQEAFSELRNKVIVTLGLTYKVGTDTLRRSEALELCQWLNERGASVVAYDPVIKALPKSLMHAIELKETLNEAVKGADGLIVATEWPQFTELTPEQLVAANNIPQVFDMNGFLIKTLGNDQRIRYHSVGRIV